MKIIAVDFDGCLCTNAFPDIGEPNWDVINHLIGEENRGAKIILWTCRVGEKLKEAVYACQKWGIGLAAVNENLPEIIEEFGGDTRKVVATEYWDDRAVLADKDHNGY